LVLWLVLDEQSGVAAQDGKLGFGWEPQVADLAELEGLPVRVAEPGVGPEEQPAGAGLVHHPSQTRRRHAGRADPEVVHPLQRRQGLDPQVVQATVPEDHRNARMALGEGGDLQR
jgi:hypothetical protein